MNKNKKRAIVIYVDNLDRLRFFSRMEQSLIDLGFEVVILTNRFSVVLKSLFSRKNIYLARGSNSNKYAKDIGYEIDAGLLSSKDANMLSCAIVENFRKICDSYIVSFVLLWNGSGTAEFSIGKMAKREGIPTLFYEVANVPGKLFIDPMGVNAKSKISKSGYLDKPKKATSDQYQIWLDEYISKKAISHVVPQSGGVKRVNYWYILDLLGMKFLKTPPSQKIPLLKKIKSKAKSKIQVIAFDKADLQKENYVFFPLQVETDSQLFVNSKIGNLEGIKKAAGIARGLGCALFLKPHPAEVDPFFIKKVYLLKKELDFKIVAHNTFSLLENATAVVTINSTVGLEGKLMGKEVHTLGDTLYGQFTKENLISYIMNYLFDVDYFKDTTIGKDLVERMLERAFP